MTLAWAAGALAWFAMAFGLTLAICHSARKRVPKGFAWAHGFVGTAAIVCLWTAVVLMPGKPDMAFNSGAFVVSLAFVVGALMFSLRQSRAPLPGIIIGMHGTMAVIGGLLLLAGLLHP